MLIKQYSNKHYCCQQQLEVPTQEDNYTKSCVVIVTKHSIVTNHLIMNVGD
nr:MAG TPA: hypothetical protein [Caudoviricetes sp.]